ncbi:unnamed protein product [Timema podura]|uniref:Arginase n=1 Tax=Timema podura TaxID=61482 RepID=A0ABN7NM94_TIMPD|nr:unnamed protein product [Timema podura]
MDCRKLIFASVVEWFNVSLSQSTGPPMTERSGFNPGVGKSAGRDKGQSGVGDPWWGPLVEHRHYRRSHQGAGERGGAMGGAHAVLNTADTSPTENIHGMPVALLAKELSNYWPQFPGMDWLKPTVHLERKGDTPLSAGSGLAGHSLVHDRPCGAYPDVLLHVLPSQVSEKVQDVMKDGRVCVTLGGDHSLSIGTVDGHVKARGDVAVLWVDAHADLNTADTSTTGNVHGMPVALLAKELSDYWPYLPGMDWQKPTLSIKQFAYIGLRSVDEYERVIMDKYSITAFGMEDIEYKGIINVVNEALQSIDPLSRLPLHVSFDIDCLDSLEAPSTGTYSHNRVFRPLYPLVRGGMSLREGIQVMEQAHRTGRLSAVDLVEVNPSIGDKRDVHLTLQAAKHLLQAVFGRQRRGNYPNDELVKLVNYNKLDKETNELSET